MDAHRLRRQAIELGPLEAWFHQGRGSFHFENLDLLRHAFRLFLLVTGLRRTGERNCLAHVVRRVTFRSPRLPAAFDGFRILHLSDLHIDGLAGLAEAIAARVAEHPCDLCVLTGDYRFENSGPIHGVERGMRTVTAAVRAREGTLAILGNHDFSEIGAALAGQGVRMLVNAAHEIRRGGESLWVAGVDDPHYYGCDDLEAALAGVPAGAYAVLLAHSPELYREAEARGASLYLCGHTHGGQFRLPLLGPPVLNARCPRRLCAGAWRHGGMDGYTSAGAGASVAPARFFCPPEIAVIDLARSQP